MVSSKDIRLNIKEIANKYNLAYFEVLQRYMFERIIERISLSKYKDNFILKGGLLLSSIFGIDNRVTKDMDTLIKGIDVSKENMVKILNEILAIDVNDGVKFDIVKIEDIREDDDYGGNRYYIVGRVDNTKVNLEIDISTGDTITPRELKYKYPSMFQDKSYLISCYNNETIIAEKLETVLRRGTFNSRMKDFYDLYTYFTKLNKEIDYEVLKKAIENTFSKRDSLSYLKDYEVILDNMEQSTKLKEAWADYRRKNAYAFPDALGDILLEIRECLQKKKKKQTPPEKKKNKIKK